MSKFRKGDRDAIILLLAFALVCIIIFPFVNDWMGIDFDVQRKVRAYKNNTPYYNKGKAAGDGYYYVPEKQGELFPFDPNTADSTQLLRLGLRPWQVRSIYKYRAAGGRYRKPTDFARLYGLTLKQYKRLEPYIRIEEEVMAADVYGKERVEYPRESYDYPEKLTRGEYVNINTADSAQLVSIPGIGPYYARQILGKRARLGGFASPKQLLEIDGFPVSALEYMTVSAKSSGESHASASSVSVSTSPNSPSISSISVATSSISASSTTSLSASSTASDGKSVSAKPTGELHKIHINRDDIRTMSRHPYLRYYQAKDIEKYRRLKGALHSPADLRRLPSFTPDDIARLTPYLDFD